MRDPQSIQFHEYTVKADDLPTASKLGDGRIWPFTERPDMAMRTIDSADDPLLDPYRSLKETNADRDAGGFVAEGRRLFLRLLETGWPMESILVSDRDLEKEVGSLLHRVPPEIPVFVLPHYEVRRLIGFKFHRGILVRAKNRPSPSLESIGKSSTRIVDVSALRDPSNLGSVARTAVAFGWDALLVGPSTPHAFSRRTLRTSMGAVLRLKVATVDNVAPALRQLQQEFGFSVYAAETTPAAQPFHRLAISERLVLVLGNEDEGVPASILDVCTAVAAIPMTNRVESLNVASAAAVLLQHFGRVE
jgi:tRNA G18 (ribose-2'-O)-methylase SpoU